MEFLRARPEIRTPGVGINPLSFLSPGTSRQDRTWMGNRLGTPGAVDFFRSAVLLSTTIYLENFAVSKEVYFSHNSSIIELFLEEAPILALSIAVFRFSYAKSWNFFAHGQKFAPPVLAINSLSFLSPGTSGRIVLGWVTTWELRVP